MMSAAFSVAVIGSFEYSFSRITQKCERIKKAKEAIEKCEQELKNNVYGKCQRNHNQNMHSFTH